MSETEGRNNAESEAQDRENNALTEGKNEEAEDEGFHEVSTADEEDHIGKEKSAGSKKNPTSRVKEAKSYASSRSSTHTFNKKTQQMVAELQRLKIQMSEFHQSVQRPPVNTEFQEDMGTNQQHLELPRGCLENGQLSKPSSAVKASRQALSCDTMEQKCSYVTRESRQHQTSSFTNAQFSAIQPRTVQDWHRMNLVELKKLPPSPRYHIKKAIVSYLGTTPGSSRALAPLTKALSAGTNQDEGAEAESQSPSGKGKQRRSQILGELYRVKKEMIGNSNIVTKPEVKPYTPDVFNDLSPYYNKFIVDYMINDQVDYVPRPGWGTRATSLRVVDPDVSWRMDHFPGPMYDSVVPRGPEIFLEKMAVKEAQDFLQFQKKDIERHKESKAQSRMKEDHRKTVDDWNRMNLAELKALPLQSRFHVKKTIVSYLGTSTGSNKALKPLLNELSTDQGMAQSGKS
ncbi:hypothetical protein P5673_031364 [Acropora cervicornis]|uniref:Uncharacterized protein n=1 Tax=Acropora cervicornis TaxID=6130 RepID=A0AAD9PSW2_ACRCE|nr:hypothetical protein P5673_031364 [Acropora cervicornis]